MKKFKYGGSVNDWEDQLNQEVLQQCKSLQKVEMIVLMEKKARELCECLSFGTYTERLLFLDAFYKGYFAAHCFDEAEEQLILTLSPLGQALK